MTDVKAQIERLRAEVVATYPHGFMLRDYDQGAVDAYDKALDAFGPDEGLLVSLRRSVESLRREAAANSPGPLPPAGAPGWRRYAAAVARFDAFGEVLDLVRRAEKKREAGQ